MSKENKIWTADEMLKHLIPSEMHTVKTLDEAIEWQENDVSLKEYSNKRNSGKRWSHVAMENLNKSKEDLEKLIEIKRKKTNKLKF